MKEHFLKLANVKDEKSFYKLYPDEQSFMAKYGKEVKKLLRGDAIKKAASGWEGYDENYNTVDVPQSMSPMGKNIPFQQGMNQGLKRGGLPISQMQNSAQRGGPSTTSLLPSQQPKLAPVAAGKGGMDIAGMLGSVGGDIPGKVIGGIQKIIDEKKALNKAKQWNNVSDIQLQASQTKDVDASQQVASNASKRRQMMLPENTVEAFFPIYGTKNGTNPLGKNGKKIQKATEGVDVSGMIGGQLDKITPLLYGDNGGADLGGTLGGTVGKIFGPAGELIGKQVGQLGGYLLDPNPRKTKKLNDQTYQNANMMAMSNMGQNVQQQNSSFMRAGGHLQEYIPPSERAMETFAMGGDLQTHWGGYAEPISQNPYLPEGGETVMFRGNSHEEADGKGRTGIGMTFGKSPVEVEKGEPAVKLSDGGQDNSLVVFGNLPIHNNLLPLLGDPDAKGKRFKNYVASLSKKEERQNNTIDKTSSQLEELDPITPFDKLKLNSLSANIKGTNMSLKELAQKKETAAALQQAINDTAEEHGVVADDLAKGNIKYAKLGTTLHKADGGKKVGHLGEGNYTDYATIRKAKEEGNFVLPHQGEDPLSSGFYGGVTPQNIVSSYPKQVLQDAGLDPSHPEKWGKDAASKIENTIKTKYPDMYSQLNDKTSDTANKFGLDWYSLGKGNPTSSMKLPEPPKPELLNPWSKTTLSSFGRTPGFETPKVVDRPQSTQENIPQEKKYPGWMDAVNSMIPYFRPSDAEQLDPRQLSGEMFAMSQNQQEPVPLQTFQPQLTVPYDISLQDQLNENQATFRGAQRMVGNNPAAQANLAAQQYGANERVLGEQFRQNQGMKNQTYAQNRQALDNAQLHNLQAYDQQATRQSQAKSNTKEVAQAALSSIADKFMKNRLENKTLQTYENMYNYRYDNRMRAQNMNPLAQFNTELSGRSQNSMPEEMLPTYTSDESGNPKLSGYKKKKTTSRNGSIVSAYKNL